jgi:formate hydrogenlyase subunit 3/multisubunit Na+/H+ antiporter MnhD subunit
MTLSQVHDALANASLIFSLIIGVYGFGRYFTGQGINASFWGVLASGQLLYMVQAGTGLWLMLAGFRAARMGVHILYGVILVLVLPGLYAATRGRDGRREQIMYALVGLFLAGVSLRAMATAQFF